MVVVHERVRYANRRSASRPDRHQSDRSKGLVISSGRGSEVNPHRRASLSHAISSSSPRATETIHVIKDFHRCERTLDRSATIRLSVLLPRLTSLFADYLESLRKELKDLFADGDEHVRRGSELPKRGHTSDESREFDQAVEHAMYCLQPAVRPNITIFDLSSDEKLSETIFRSVCSCKQTAWHVSTFVGPFRFSAAEALPTESNRRKSQGPPTSEEKEDRAAESSARRTPVARRQRKARTAR